MSTSLSTKLSFGAGAFGRDFGLALVNTFLMFYYTDAVGVSATFVGSIFLIARLWDAINDPIMGMIVQKTRTRWGKFKPWILIGNILNAIFIVALFSAHQFSGTALKIYIAVTYIGWGMTYTLQDAPFWSLVPTITLDKREREQFMPYPRIFATLAALVVTGFGLQSVEFLGGGDKAQGYFIFAAIGGLVCILGALATCKWTKQVVKEDNSTVAAPSFTLKDAVTTITKNDQLLVLLTFGLLYMVLQNLSGGFGLYFFKYVLEDETIFSTFMFWGGVCGFIAVTCFSKLAAWLGRKTLFSLCLLLYTASCGVLFISTSFAPDSSLLVSFAGALNGTSIASFWLMFLLMIGEAVDYGDYKLGRRSESLMYSMQSFIGKTAGAIIGFVVGLSLTAMNYVPNQEQAAETVMGIQVFYLAVPAVLSLVTLYIFRRFYKLNDELLLKVQKAMKAKYENVAAVPDEDAIGIPDKDATAVPA